MKKLLILSLLLCACSSVEKKAAENVSDQRTKPEAVEKRLEDIIKKL